MKDQYNDGMGAKKMKTNWTVGLWSPLYFRGDQAPCMFLMQPIKGKKKPPKNLYRWAKIVQADSEEEAIEIAVELYQEQEPTDYPDSVGEPTMAKNPTAKETESEEKSEAA